MMRQDDRTLFRTVLKFVGHDLDLCPGIREDQRLEPLGAFVHLIIELFGDLSFLIPFDISEADLSHSLSFIYQDTCMLRISHEALGHAHVSTDSRRQAYPSERPILLA